MATYGYALALFSLLRDEPYPEWSNFLRPDVRDAFQKSLQYLQEHDLPNLRRVATTEARPANHDAFADDSSSEADESVEELDVCTYCGAALSDEVDDGICSECRESIEDHEQELIKEAGRTEQKNELATRIATNCLNAEYS